MKLYKSYRDIPVEIVSVLLRYDDKSGRLFWLERGDAFEVPGAHGDMWEVRRWNSRYAGREAFGFNAMGYREGRLLGCGVKAHHVIWALNYGRWPVGEIDHIDGDRANNRIDNLRLGDRVSNMRNLGVSARNTSGHVGVGKKIQRNGRLRWVAYIRANGRQRHIGHFDTFEDACIARQRASAQHGFHPNHGMRPAFSGRGAKGAGVRGFHKDVDT